MGIGYILSLSSPIFISLLTNAHINRRGDTLNQNKLVECTEKKNNNNIVDSLSTKSFDLCSVICLCSKL